MSHYGEPQQDLIEASRQEEDLPLLGVTKDGRISPELEMEIKNRILATKSQSEQFYSGKRARWLDYFEHYIGKKRNRTRTTIPSTLAGEAVDIVEADMVGRSFSTKPFCKVRGRSAEDQKRAPIVEALQEYQLFKMGIFGINKACIKSTLIYGGCPYRIVFDSDVVEIPIPNTRGEFKVTQYYGPRVIVYDIFDYFPGKSKVDVNDAADSVVRMYRPYEYLVERQDNFPAIYQNVNKIQHKRIANLQTDDIDARSERHSHMGIDPEPTARGLVEILEADIWWPVESRDGTLIQKPCVFTLANGQLVRATRNNMISQDGNMGLAMIDKLPNDLYGMGLIEKMHPQIHGANVTLDMILTSLEHGIDPMKVYSKDQVKADGQAKLRNRAGGLVPVRGDARTAVANLPHTNVAPDAYTVFSLFTSGAEAAGGVNAPKKGQSIHSTATVNLQAGEQAQSRFNLYMMMYEDTFTKNICLRMLKINQQFQDFPQLVPVLEGQTSEWKQVEADDIAIDADFEPQGTQKSISTQMEIAQIEHFLALAGNIEALAPIIPHLVGKLARAFRWPEATEIEGIAQQGLQQFLMQQQMIRQQAQASPSGRGINQIGTADNMAGMNATNDTDLNQSLGSQFGPSSVN